MDFLFGCPRLGSPLHPLTFVNSSKIDRIQQAKGHSHHHQEPKVCQPVILYCTSTDMKPNPPLNPTLHPTRQGVLPNP